MTDNYFSFIFDSGDKQYSHINIFEILCSFLSNEDHSTKIQISHGDLLSDCRIVDIEPYINRNEMCTIDQKPQFKDWPYFVCLYGITSEQKKKIDLLFRDKFGYKGCSNIEIKTKIKTKKIWKAPLIHDIEVEKDDVYFYSFFEQEDHPFEQLFKKYNFKTHYMLDNLKLPFKQEDTSKENYLLVQHFFAMGYRLNIEVRIAGGLIWDSIEKLANLSYFSTVVIPECEPPHAEDAYMCIYNASQGIERLQKVLIELLLRRDNCNLENEENMYDLLMSHSHIKMNDFLKTKINIDLNRYNKLNDALSKFYNEIRYNNYSIESQYSRTFFFDILFSFSANIKNKDSISIAELESFKTAFAKVLGDYACLLYDEIREVSELLGNYTYELDDSKSTIVFNKGDLNLYELYKRYQNSKKEVLYALAINGAALIPDTIKESFEPLNFDDSILSIYCNDIIYNKEYEYFYEISTIYDELCSKNKKKFWERLQLMNYLFSSEYSDSLTNDDEDE